MFKIANFSWRDILVKGCLLIRKVNQWLFNFIIYGVNMNSLCSLQNSTFPRLFFFFLKKNFYLYIFFLVKGLVAGKRYVK